MAEPPGPGTALYGQANVGPISNLQAYTPGLKPLTKAIQHAPELYAAGKLGWKMGQMYRQMGKGYNDSPVGQNVGSSGGSPVWNGNPNEEPITANTWDVPSSSGSGAASAAEGVAEAL